MIPSRLVLKDGTVFHGFSPSWQSGTYYGEVVFSTGMTGYPESLTDPSYTGQILTFTYPLIGNYGVTDQKAWESQKVHASGVVVSEACANWSHSGGKQSLLQWLKAQNCPIITGVDTRALTRKIRSEGTAPGAICVHEKSDYKFLDLSKECLVKKVSVDHAETYNDEEKVVICVDCGMKENILRSLQKLPVTVKRVPWDYDYSNEDFDGLFLSNGPGNPAQCDKAIEVLRKALKRKKPTFGICLGSQLLALAAGAETYKLPYGHRGHNQPCEDVKTGRCYVTSQNHGYAIKEETLPADWYVSFRNLNDGTVEGIAHKELPFFTVQFHPEAAPGPTDTEWLFEKFYSYL